MNMRIDLWTSSFCGACASARRSVAEVSRLVPALEVVERDIAFQPEEAERERIRSTPTIIVRNTGGAEVFRSPGVPSRDQLLVAISRALD